MYINIQQFKTFIDNGSSPDVSFLPMLVRRKLDTTGKIVVGLAHALTQDKNNYKSVYASRYGCLNDCIKLFESLNAGMGVSPNGFSSSVHNFPIGMQSIISKNKASYTAISGCENTLELGLLEALCQNQDVLYIYAQDILLDTIQANHEPQKIAGIGLFVSPAKENIGIKVEFGCFNNNSIQFEKLAEFLQNGGEICGRFLKLSS